jgi:hypothetical protein
MADAGPQKHRSAALFNGYFFKRCDSMSARARHRVPAQGRALACRRRFSVRYRRASPRARGLPRWGTRACSVSFLLFLNGSQIPFRASPLDLVIPNERPRRGRQGRDARVSHRGPLLQKQDAQRRRPPRDRPREPGLLQNLQKQRRHGRASRARATDTFVPRPPIRLLTLQGAEKKRTAPAAP